MLTRYAHLTSIVVVLWQLEGIAQKQKENAVVAGIITYAGKHIHEVTSTPVEFSFRDEKGNEVTPRILYERGKYEVFDLPVGRYRISVSIDKDYFSEMYEFEVSSYRGAKWIHVEMIKYVHLRAPEDITRSTSRGSACKDLCLLRSPVRFSWDQLTTVGPDVGVTYYYEVHRLSCSSFQDLGVAKSINRFTQMMVDTYGSTHYVPEIFIELPPSAESECYSFIVSARTAFDSGRELGRTREFRFRVSSAGETAALAGKVARVSTENPIYRLAALFRRLPYRPDIRALTIMTPYNVLVGQWRFIGTNVTKLVSFMSTDTGYVMMSDASFSPRRLFAENGLVKLSEVSREGGADKVEPSQYALFYIEDLDCLVQASVFNLLDERNLYSYGGTWRAEGSGELVEVKRLENYNFQMRSNGKEIPVIEDNWMLRHYIPQPTFALMYDERRNVLLRVVGIYERVGRE